MFIRTFPQTLCLLATVSAAFGQSLPPGAYYDSAIGPTGAALKFALHGIIDGHTVLPYTATTARTRGMR